MKRIDFQTSPDKYRHWRIEPQGEVAKVIMDVDETGGLFDGYELKLNSYDLGVDIELADVIQRLRFEHPEVKTVVMASGKDKVFCAGANIRMLGGAAHSHKVNFCKFTNETRNSIEDATDNSHQTWLCAVSGACAGGGYELALACDEIILTDDGTSTVALPEVPLLAVLPGTGGLTRVTDKRKVRRDRADIFCSLEEGIRGKKAVDWRLVDAVAPASKFDEAVAARAKEVAAKSDRPSDAKGVKLTRSTRPSPMMPSATRPCRWSLIAMRALPPSPSRAPKQRRLQTWQALRQKVTSSGRSSWRASWTMHFWKSASMSLRWLSSSSSRRAIRPQCWRLTTSCKPMTATG
jgi:benzoyl-CoA-dihydrodiol lyase